MTSGALPSSLATSSGGSVPALAPTTAWRPPSEPVPVGDPERLVMLIAGQSFCLGSETGDVVDGAPHGWFVADRRVLSRCEIFVNGAPLDVLATHRAESYESVHVGRSAPGPDRSVLLIRRRTLDVVLSDELEIRNHLAAARRFRIVIKVAADFANLFAVKDGRSIAVEPVVTEIGDDICFIWRQGDRERVTTVEATGETPHSVRHGRFLWDFVLEPQQSATVGLIVSHRLQSGQEPSKTPTRSVLSSRDRTRNWASRTARVENTSSMVERVVRRSMADLGSLRLDDDGSPDDQVVAAGAPWFMTLFGRDSLLTAYMTVMFDHSIGRGSVNALARLQGDSVDETSEEEPGRILHELRFANATSFSLADGSPYYGTADATPLFVMVVGELVRWGALDALELRRLLPAVDRAIAWIDDYGDLDGDGFVEYLVRSEYGLVNQGWKDSHDGIRYADGRIAEAPMALAEVQAYVYGALVARAHIAGVLGEPAEPWIERAAAFADRFDEGFWIDDQHGYAVGLDAHKQPIDSIASNMGHCLWTGIAKPHRAAAIAALLDSPEMWSGWGLRTLSSANPGYDPLSYHCGSVWPHDTALAAAGLMRYGFVEQATRMAEATFQMADHFNGRLPELIAGIGRDEFSVPVRYPTSCSPQAWAAAAPVYLLRVLLGAEPDLAADQVRLDPHLPSWIGGITLRNVPFGERTVDIRV
jgi:glycogen debranching enzyme